MQSQVFYKIFIIYSIHKTYSFIGILYTRLYANVNNPFLSIAYSEWPFYDQSNLEHDFYSIEDRKKLLAVFDSIEKPTLYDLCVGFIFETSTRNGEARAIRFCDFHFDSEIPYVRICGKAENGHREEREKKILRLVKEIWL